jgi:hypothetical protein
MNSTLKHTFIAMATAALSFTAACGSDDETPQSGQASSGGETATQGSCGGENTCGSTGADAGAQHSCSQGSCSGSSGADAGAAQHSCSQGSCGSAQ